MSFRVAAERGLLRRASWVTPVLLSVSSAWAQASSKEARPIAEGLFEQGRVALEAGHYDEACSKLAESHKIDPAAGTLLNLAVCHELAGKIATAWSEYNDAAALASRNGESARAQIATERSGRLRARISYLTLKLSDAARAEGLVVAVDGLPIGAAAWGTALSIDPGEHRVEATAPGRVAWSSTVRIGIEADRQTLKIPELARLPLARPVVPPCPAPPAPARDSAALARMLGFGAIGAGALAAGFGAFFGLRAQSAWADRNRHCPNARCDARAVEAGREAKRFAVVADAALALSVLAAGTGVYVLVVAGHVEKTPIPKRTSDWMLGYRGRF